MASLLFDCGRCLIGIVSNVGASSCTIRVALGSVGASGKGRVAEMFHLGVDMKIPPVFEVEDANLLNRIASLYRDLHAHPEVSMEEFRTARIVASQLRGQGWDVTEQVGVTGVVGVLRNGTGPTVLLRADMDALPIQEATGLDYASSATATSADGRRRPVMHACGHDAHVACLLGVAEVLARHRRYWAGSVLLVFQPGEEIGMGARAMLDDGLLDRFGSPDVCLAQHLMPIPSGHASLSIGTAMAAADSLRIRHFGRGGHGSTPELTVDPIIMGAATVMRLQTIVSREISYRDPTVVTVGAFHAGTKENVIPDEAELRLSVRYFDPKVRSRVLASIRRIVSAEARASGAYKEPEVEVVSAFPLTFNDPDAARTVRDALECELGRENVHIIPPKPGSEDFGLFGAAAGVPSVMWFWGGHDPSEMPRFTGLLDSDQLPPGVPVNHSAQFAPVIDPTLRVGLRCLLAASLAWLHKTGSRAS